MVSWIVVNSGRRANMRNVKVMLLQAVPNKGEIGDTIDVKPGFARNYLYPTGRAVYATPENIEKYSGLKQSIIESNKAIKDQAEMEKRMNATEILKRLEIENKQKEAALQDELTRTGLNSV